MHATKYDNDLYAQPVLRGRDSDILHVALDFKDKIKYTSYVSLGSQILYITTNKCNINRQCSIYNVLSINNITLDSKH